MTSIYDWLPLLPADIESVKRIADVVHPTLPESKEVFLEKVILHPLGCRKLIYDNILSGYGICHPWKLYSVPRVDCFINTLPPHPDCLYIHDIAILPHARGQNAAGRYINYIKQLALESSIPAVTLVSVYGTNVLWSRFGFRGVEIAELDNPLASYGKSAQYMVYFLQ
jgi:ribosomal protein S18 acetylase RimI-like enzyme